VQVLVGLCFGGAVFRLCEEALIPNVPITESHKCFKADHTRKLDLNAILFRS
jgi:hypothetical protein